MKLMKSLFVVMALVGGMSANIASASHASSHFVAHQSFAHHHGWRPRPGWGPVYYGPWPWFYPWYLGYSIPVLPTTLYVEPPTEQYIEMNPPANAPANIQPNMWYYCSNPQGYYPYVASCSTTWQEVPAQPPRQ